MKRADKNLKKEQAEKLRLRGVSYGKISKKLKIPKSTLSLWLKDIPLSLEDKQRLYTKQVQMITSGNYSQKQRREKDNKNSGSCHIVWLDCPRKIVAGIFLTKNY